ncbi:MAG: beta-lactamase family protein [Clostridiales bacterium]|nr:beta-lactamase family protein [Clostridiales bacterium]
MNGQQMERTLQQAVADGFIAGGNLLVLKDGKEQFYCQAGYADRQAGLPIERNTIFRLYSMSKPVTAAAVMILMEEGRIDLMDPVGMYIKSFQDQNVWTPEGLVPVERPMEIRDLLSMTSGLVYGGGPSVPEQEAQKVFDEAIGKLGTAEEIGTVEMAERLGACPLMFQPGASFMYGTSADILGAVVEVVSGQSFGAFLKEHIFDPLGMEDTGFYVPEAKQGRLSKVYINGQSDKEYKFSHLDIQNEMKFAPRFESGGAGLVSTVTDYARFATMLLNGGTYKGQQILKESTVRFMTGHHLTAPQQAAMDFGWPGLAGYSYGNLMRTLVDPSKAVHIVFDGEYGWDGWLGAYFCNAPEDKMTFLLMYQLTDTGTTRLTRMLLNELGAAL